MNYIMLQNRFEMTAPYSDNPEERAAYDKYMKSTSAAERRRIVADFYYNPTGENINVPKEEASTYSDALDHIYDDIDKLADDQLEDKAQLIKDKMNHPEWKDYQLDSANTAGGLDPATKAEYTTPYKSSLGEASVQKRLKNRAESTADSYEPGNSIGAGITRAGSWLGFPVLHQADRMNREGLNTEDLSLPGTLKLGGQGILDAALWTPRKAYSFVGNAIDKGKKIPAAVKSGAKLLLDFSNPVKQGIGSGVSTALNEPAGGEPWVTNSLIPDVVTGGASGVGLGTGSFLLKKGNTNLSKLSKAAKKESGKQSGSTLDDRLAEFNALTEKNLPAKRKEIIDLYGTLNANHPMPRESPAEKLGNPTVSIEGIGAKEIGSYDRPIDYLSMEYSPEDILDRINKMYPDWHTNLDSFDKAIEYANHLANWETINNEGDALKKLFYKNIARSNKYKSLLKHEENQARESAEEKAARTMDEKYGKNWDKKSKLEAVADAFMHPTQVMAKKISSPSGQYTINHLTPRVAIPDQQKNEADYSSWDLLPGNYTYKIPMAASKTPFIGRTLVPYQDPNETRKRSMRYGLAPWML